MVIIKSINGFIIVLDVNKRAATDNRMMFLTLCFPLILILMEAINANIDNINPVADSAYHSKIKIPSKNSTK